MNFEIPVNEDVLLKFYGFAEYKIKVCQETITKQQRKIMELEKELKTLKEESNE